MVGGNDMLLPALGGDEQRRSSVVVSVGEELQRQKWVSRPALAEVQLNGVRRPGSGGIAHHHEVDGEPAQHALPGEPPAYDARTRADGSGGGEIRREPAAQVALPAWTTQELVMG